MCPSEQVKREISVSTNELSLLSDGKKSIPNVEISIQAVILLQFRFILLAFFFFFCPSPLLCSPDVGSGACSALQGPFSAEIHAGK